MSADAVFPVLNLLPLPVWVVWIAAPRSRVARQLAEALWPWGLLAVVYAVCVLMASLGEAPGPGSFFSLGGVMSIFDAPWAATAGWVHFLCFDLFCARWMVNEAPEAGYKLAPVLLLTLFYGPVGLLAFLMLRSQLVPARA